ncbi:MAG: SUMF1/EgtB/PvdO family nonheme iron enzyme, partial [Gallionella sp.]|nr:SUMF1/EgtB/PvdO family nonheme iron enzyme [Gallionella sp.]
PRAEHVNVFAIARRPVSRAEYAAYLASHGRPAQSAAPALASDGRPAREAASARVSDGRPARGAAPERASDGRPTRGATAPTGDPIDGLSWADAIGYCRWLTRATGRTYRLPDEREWEKAARAGVIEAVGRVLEWTNTWSAADGARVLRGDPDLARSRFVTGDLAGVGFRVVRGMTGR